VSLARGAALVALLATAAPASAQVTVWANGVYDFAAPSWSHGRTFREYVEDARYDVRYEAEAAAGFDLGIQVSLVGGFGPELAFSRVNHDAARRLDASIPHPLRFDRYRSASVEFPGLGYSEQAVHMGVGWQGQKGALGFALFGGLSLFKVRADAVEEIGYDQFYPYDEIELRAPRVVEHSDEPIGFHVGGRLDWRLFRSFGLGGQLRYSAATASFSLPGGDAFEIDAGGLQVAAGIRVFF